MKDIFLKDVKQDLMHAFSETLENFHHDTLQPETLQPDTLQPDTLQPETLQPETLQPDTLANDFMALFKKKDEPIALLREILAKQNQILDLLRKN